jgi:hypothetical protein
MASKETTTARFPPDVLADVERIRLAQPASTSTSAALVMLVELGIARWDEAHMDDEPAQPKDGPRKAGKR